MVEKTDIDSQTTLNILKKTCTDKQFLDISEKICSCQRISTDDCLFLYQFPHLSGIGLLADFIRRKKNNLSTFFIRNIHIEPTNICIYNCRFCSYSKKEGQKGAFRLNEEEIVKIIKDAGTNIKEIHITGGAHPQYDLNDYCNFLNLVRHCAPDVHIKAFSAVELHYLSARAGISYVDILNNLKECGLGSLPGGGAEIFDKEIRQKICPDKAVATEWLRVHETAHSIGIRSNASMLYGHIESYVHRVKHMEILRNLQDKTAGFNAFIPLKFRRANNQLSSVPELSITEDLKNFAVARIFLDNFQHIKGYWPMLGAGSAQLSLSFGVDDLDGTIQDTTTIYSSAGAEEQNPSMTAEVMSELISAAGYTPVERDSEYRPV